MLFLSLILLAALAIIYLYSSRRHSKSTLRLPPGPKGLPIVGNVFDLPPEGIPEYEHWLKLKDVYGPISSMSVLGTTLVILHSHEAVQELLVKKSTRTSARPAFYFSNMCGLGNLTPLLTSGPVHRQHHKLMHQKMGTKLLATRFSSTQDVESRRLLLRALDDPEHLMEHIKTEASAIILKIVYDYTIEPHKADPLVSLIERAMDTFSKTVLPFAWAVDIIPQLRYLPSWLPGVSFHKTAREWRRVNESMIDVPYDFVMQQMSRGTFTPSYVSHYLEHRDENSGEIEIEKQVLSQQEEKALKNSAAILFGAGSDTTVSSVISFILAMILYPEVQRRAQQEIDQVVGGDRLPCFEDRDRLPYMNAVIKETYRWMPVVPIGTAHVAEEEIVFSGYRIPKGAYLLPSIWWFMHDPETYANPSEFNPDRFLAPEREEPDPRDHVFGYGRRICPGRYLADGTIFLTISRIIATLDVTAKLDDRGKPVDLKREATAGLISHPMPFPFSIAPRSLKHAELIRSTEIDHPWEESDSVHLVGVDRVARGV
ncbi:hypothetical protein E4U56_000649 [Claviceps arundinis]|uniref:O-methylsterigmatocystin oxidoreductase n=1 Tax=Claviceps arundinis TaxID=1623583 RepID=A0A9P7SQ45_9HYPO|nr:hypothetical protein E4U56_000649 [Claviceps arundinis]